jgi:hypothetical protein
MNRKELAEALAKNTDTSNAAADRTIAAFIDIISGALRRAIKWHSLDLELLKYANVRHVLGVIRQLGPS